MARENAKNYSKISEALKDGNLIVRKVFTADKIGSKRPFFHQKRYIRYEVPMSVRESLASSHFGHQSLRFFRSVKRYLWDNPDLIR